MMAKLALFVFLAIARCYAEEVLKVPARDSYLEAYEDTKSANNAQKKSDFGYPVYPGPGAYGPPQVQYGPPAPHYGSYAEPSPQYGPPIYGPPAQNLQVFYGVPHAMISIWDRVWEKIKWKLDLFTLGKILLKLVIFKKIVSLIAILCLLLFIPSLKHKKGFMGEDSEKDRRLKLSKDDDRLDEAAAFVAEAVRRFMAGGGEESGRSCGSKYCKARKLMKIIDKKTSYRRLAELYANEKDQ